MTEPERTSSSGSAAAAAAAERRLANLPSSPRSAEAGLSETRKKIVHIINSELLDFKHCSPARLEACVGILLKLCTNVAENPEKENFRQVKAANKKFSESIDVKRSAALKVFMEAGWTSKVVNLEKHYVFEGQPSSPSFRRLQVAIEELRVAQELLIAKGQRGTSRQEQKAEEASRRASAMLQFQDDRDRRRLQDEQAQAAAHLAALAAEQAAEQAAADREAAEREAADGGGADGSGAGYRDLHDSKKDQ
ncbi:hypothetical protein WJX73_007630 [Symbiochloris irregularis]|uniref:PUB domain-containing protein n=1 Tax=Symbiochloris irregularis TaxID=706552 RepID=A0AAW1PML8_9CHLO